MASQWLGFKSKLDLFVEESSYQKKVDEAKQFLLGTLEGEHANINRLAALFATRKTMKQAHENAVYDLNIEIKALSQLLIDAYEAQGIEKSTLATGETGYLGYFISTSISDENAFYAWLHEKNMDTLKKIHPSTLKGLTGEMLQNGEPAPPGVKVYLGTEFRILNSRKGDKDEQQDGESKARSGRSDS